LLRIEIILVRKTFAFTWRYDAILIGEQGKFAAEHGYQAHDHSKHNVESLIDLPSLLQKTVCEVKT